MPLLTVKIRHSPPLNRLDRFCMLRARVMACAALRKRKQAVLGALCRPGDGARPCRSSVRRGEEARGPEPAADFRLRLCSPRLAPRDGHMLPCA